jgi:signal transduction histidine kinase
LSVARPNDPDAPLESVDVIESIHSILALVRTHIEHKQVEIVTNFPTEGLPPVLAVRGWVDDVWLNLLLNANDALLGREDATIGISISYLPGDQYILIVIWDNGPGIPKTVYDRIFEPFYTTKPVGEGTGLGLYICRQVVERVGGSIDVESEIDEGTRFLVRLPVAST